LAQYTEAGDLIRETGGLRKIRWSVSVSVSVSVTGRGERGVRVICYYVSAQAQCRMLLMTLRMI
jgi:hypothetical protein